METVLMLIRQTAIMFAMMAIGFILFRSRKITAQGSKEMGSVLLYLVIPAVIVSSFCIERTPQNIHILFEAAGVSLAAMIIACLISWLVYGTNDGIACFSAAFSNAGFIGIPLVSAVIGEQGVFYVSFMIVLVNLLQWTFGAYVISADASMMSPKKILTNPVAIGLFIGLIIFFTGIPVPEIIRSVLKTVSGMNTPLAMIVSGVYLAQTDLAQMLKRKDNYTVSLMRLLVIPAVTVAVLHFLPVSDPAVRTAVLIAEATPVGSNVAVFAQQMQ